jgi:hypothetical protein
MDILEMNVSKLRQGSNKKIITNGIDTTTVAIFESGTIDSPFIEVETRLTNKSGIEIKLCPDSSHVYMTYVFEGERYKKNMYFYYSSNKTIGNEKSIILYPDQSIQLSSSGNIAAASSIELKFYKQQDNTINILKILPTLKFHYKDKSGLIVTHQDVFNVNVRERPFGSSDFQLPSGYYIIP